MKFYTKQWYDLMQRLDYCLCMKSIADEKARTDEQIRRLYDRALKKYVADAEREHDTPPEFVEIDLEDIDPDEFAFFDENTGKLEKPSSAEEIKARLNEEMRLAREQFDSRPPFDRSESVAEFKEMYENRMKYELENYPEWVSESVDARLAALGYLPASVYEKLKAESKANKREFEKINRAAHKVLAAESEKLPQRIVDGFGFHDAELLEYSERGGDVVIVLRGCFACFDGETPFIRVTFRNAETIEKDVDAFSDNDDGYFCAWLYDELYSVDGGIEAHMLFASDKTESGLACLTLRCADIDIEKNAEYDE